MADFGLLGALGEGLKTGVAGYQQERELTRKKALDEALQKKQAEQMNLDMFSKGIQDDGGVLSYRPEVQAEKQDARTLKYAQAGLLPPSEPGAQPQVFTELLKSKQEANPFRNMLQGLELQKKTLDLKEAKSGKADERQAALYGARMQAADQQAKSLEQSFDPTSASNTVSGYLPEIMKPSELKQYENSKRNFVAAVLRKESGAAISPTEYAEGNRLYFPQPGDTPEVIAQKEGTRQQAIEGMGVMAGPAKGLVSVPKPQASGLIKSAQPAPAKPSSAKLSPEQRAALIANIKKAQAPKAQGVK